MEKKEFRQKTYLYKSVYVPEGMEFLIQTDSSSFLVKDTRNNEQISVVWSEQLRHFVIRGKSEVFLPRFEQAIDQACLQLLLLRKDGSFPTRPESPSDQVRRFFD